MEASALQAPAGLARTRISLGASLLRMRSDEQLLALFRAGNDDAFRVIHDRYRNRLFAYARQMLPHLQDAEDALQDVFVRAYAGLRANDRELALRAWLYRVAHNRCVDELRRPAPPPPEVLELIRPPGHDPIARADQREALRRLIEDVRRLSDQQRSALLMRELGGMSYIDVAGALGLSVPAVKSLLVRARVTLAKAGEARDTACSDIRQELVLAHDRGVRPNAMARRHLRDCPGCRQYRGDLRGMSKQLAALVPALGPIGAIANALGIGGSAGGGAAAGGGAVAAGGVAGTASLGALTAGASHVATLIAAAVVTAGGAVEIQHTIAAPAHHRQHAAAQRAHRTAPHPMSVQPIYQLGGPAEPSQSAPVTPATMSRPPAVPAGTAQGTSSTDAGETATTPTGGAPFRRHHGLKTTGDPAATGDPSSGGQPSGTLPGSSGTGSNTGSTNSTTGGTGASTGATTTSAGSGGPSGSGTTSTTTSGSGTTSSSAGTTGTGGSASTTA